MAGDVEKNDHNVVIPERSHDQPAEGGRDQAEEALRSGADKAGEPSFVPDPEAAGIVDQQGAALRQQQMEGGTDAG
jgi:hypothetical protein